MILDSNIVIYFIQPAYASLEKYIDANADVLAVSAVSKVEVLGYHQLTPTAKTNFEDFFSKTPQYPITQPILNEATRLRQQRKMSLGDSIIAATCLLHNEPLLTNNEADFQHLPNLTVIPMRTVL
ncbi:MAG: type II toxin-antitoxin system VapC family toxin [Sphingobacteriaceae bacterium]|nr:type II toxin-antitoxin system VapC family toxin [Cytophagaceae bacterium]